jgi:hypothetical protein
MRKPKEQHDDEGNEAQFFDDFESDSGVDDDESDDGDSKRNKKPARQRVELRTEQQNLRKQLSDWDDYGQDDFDTKL